MFPVFEEISPPPLPYVGVFGGGRGAGLILGDDRAGVHCDDAMEGMSGMAGTALALAGTTVERDLASTIEHSPLPAAEILFNKLSEEP